MNIHYFQNLNRHLLVTLAKKKKQKEECSDLRQRVCRVVVPRFNWRKMILTMSAKGETDAFRLLLESDVVHMLSSIKSHSGVSLDGCLRHVVRGVDVVVYAVVMVVARSGIEPEETG